MKWDALTPTDFDQLRDLWDEIASTGTVSVDIPNRDIEEYEFLTYTNCILDEPKRDEYFAKHILKVSMLVRNISV